MYFTYMCAVAVTRIHGVLKIFNNQKNKYNSFCYKLWSPHILDFYDVVVTE